MQNTLDRSWEAIGLRAAGTGCEICCWIPYGKIAPEETYAQKDPELQIGAWLLQKLCTVTFLS